MAESEYFRSSDEYLAKSKDAVPYKILFYISLQKKEENFTIGYVDYLDAVDYLQSKNIISKTYKYTMSYPVFVSYLALKRIIKSRRVGEEIRKESTYRIDHGKKNFVLKKIYSQIIPLEYHARRYEDEYKKVIENAVEKKAEEEMHGSQRAN